MSNTVYNKATFNGQTIIDLSQDTVTSAEHIVSGHVGHLANGTQVMGTASTGPDMPVFTEIWSNDWNTLISTTCNKTVLECLLYYNNGVLTALVISKNQADTEEYSSYADVSAIGSDDITYTYCTSGIVPFADIKYNANGTIVETIPSIRYKTLNVTQNGTYYPGGMNYIAEVNVNVPATVPSLQSKSVSYTPSETAQSATVTADNGYDGLSSVAVSVGAISNTYVGSGINRNDSTDLTASGATVTAPAGYYAEASSKSVSTATQATPSISVSSGGLITATSTQSTGYVTGGTKSATQQLTTQAAKTVAPSESSQTAVASGVYTTGAVTVGAISSTYVGSGVDRRSSSDLTASGATVTVPSGFYDSQQTKSVATGTAGTPTATKGTVSNHSVSVTPSVTNGTGYISGGTKTGTAVTVSASELVSGSETKTANGTYDVTNLAELVVNVPSGSSKAIYTYKGLASRKANSYGATSASVTVTKAGTYTISYVAVRGSSSGTMGTNLHIGATSGTDNTTWTGTYAQSVILTGQTIAANTTVTIYATSGSNSRTIYVGNLIVEEQ